MLEAGGWQLADLFTVYITVSLEWICRGPAGVTGVKPLFSLLPTVPYTPCYSYALIYCLATLQNRHIPQRQLLCQGGLQWTYILRPSYFTEQRQFDSKLHRTAVSVFINTARLLLLHVSVLELTFQFQESFSEKYQLFVQ